MQNEQPHSGSRRAPRYIGPGISLAVMAAVWFAWPRQDLLMARATRIASAAGWRGDQNPYFWLSDHELLVFHAPPRNPWEPRRLDLRTGAETAMPGLNTALKSVNAPRARGIFDVALSPDRRWLVVSPSRPGAAYLLSMDGARTRRFHVNSYVHWLPDSSGVVELYGRSAGPGHICLHPLAGTATPPIRVDNLPSGYLCTGCLADGRLIVLDLSATPARQRTAHWFTISTATGEVQQHACPLAPAATSSFFQSSPTGKRGLWVTGIDAAVRPLTAVERIFKSFGLRPWSRFDFALGDSAGTPGSQLGSIPTPRDDALAGWESLPRGNCWTPDEKRISFVYKDSLYTVPVE